MPISPDAAKTITDPALLNRISEFMQVVDLALIQRAGAPSHVFTPPPDLFAHPKAREFFKAAYWGAGWHVYFRMDYDKVPELTLIPKEAKAS